MTEAQIVARIQRIFADTLNVAAPASDTDIIETALLDSLALVTLLFGIEEEFGTQIPLESLEIDDFRTIDRIARLISAAETAS